MADVADGFAQALEAGGDNALPALQRCHSGWRLRHPAQQGNGEHEPPDRHAEKRQARPPGAWDQLDHYNVDCQEQAAAQVSHGIAARRNFVLVFVFGDVRQQRIVESIGPVEADAPDYAQDGCQHPIAGAYQYQQGGADDADAGKN